MGLLTALSSRRSVGSGAAPSREPCARRERRRHHLSRAAVWLGQTWCGLTTGHTYLRTRFGTRFTLTCCACGKTFPGWDITRDLP